MKPYLENYDDVIANSGIRLTPQRRTVYEALMERRDHPTALEVFMRAKDRMPSISLATVYNCLEALTASRLIKHVNFDRAPSRYCPNPVPHGHFFCEECGAVFDIPLKQPLEETWEVPTHTIVAHTEITLRGICARCVEKGDSTVSISSLDRPFSKLSPHPS